MIMSRGRRSEPMCRQQQAHNPQNRSMVTPPKTSHGRSEYTFKEDLRLRQIARRVKHLFYDWDDKRRYQLFLCVTLITVKTPHFSLRPCWLMLEPSRCKISAEFKAGCITGLDECLNPENYSMLNIYGRCTSHQLVLC